MASRISWSLFVLFALCACEPRQPYTRSSVVGLADSFQRRLGVVWGSPMEVTPPEGADKDGRAWWQLRYQPEADGSGHIILVDNDSGWTRLAPRDWRVRRGGESLEPTLAA